MRRILLPAALLLSVAAIAACDDDESTGPQATVFTSTLSANNEVPVRASSATGTATFTVIGNTATYTISVAGLTVAPSAAHIHVGAAGTNGGVIFNFFPAGTTVPTGTTNVNFATGTIDLSLANISNAGQSVSGDSLRKLFESGNAYVNVHTATFPGGEIRDQIRRRP